jgi:predicted Rossmann fold nucleotide-binding protein DprA/Smf involved in DNA uptake
MMSMTPADVALLLTNRIAPGSAEPLKAKEFWNMVAAVPLDELAEMSMEDVATRTGDGELAERVMRLLDAATGFAVAREELESKGIRLIAPGDGAYPDRLLAMLSDAAPPMLYSAGPVEWLDTPLIGVVGSRAVDEAGAEVAKGVAVVASRIGAGIVSGGAKGVDILSMDAAYRAEIPSVGVTAEGLERASRRKELRGAVAEERLLLLSPFAPGAGFSVGSAMGRNKLIYALAVATLVVASDIDSGGTWAGATEALRRRFGAVAVWTGPGAGPGNDALVAKGASPIEDLATWDPLDAPQPAPAETTAQLGLGI